MAQMCTQTCTIRVVCVQSDLKCPESPRPCHTARWQGSWALAQSQAHAGHSESASPATQHSPHPAPPSHLQGRTRNACHSFRSLTTKFIRKNLNAPSPAFRSRPNGISQVHLLKGKENHHMQAKKTQRQFYLKGFF